MVPVDSNNDGISDIVWNDQPSELVFLSRAPSPLAAADFALADRGGISIVSPGVRDTILVGYGRIQPEGENTGPSGASTSNSGQRGIQQDDENTTPPGLAIFGLRQDGILVSEAGVPASPAIMGGRIYAEVNGPVNTGLAMANANDEAATVSFFFTDSSGSNFGVGETLIPAKGQIARFLDQEPFKGGSAINGAFTFMSSVPVSVIGLRGFTNQRSEFLITTLPLASLSEPSATEVVFPHFAAGGGWTTQIVLVNPGDSVLTGSLRFRQRSGQDATVVANRETRTSLDYTIPSRTSRKFQISAPSSEILTGSARVVPAAGESAPSGLVVFSSSNGETTVAEAGVPAVAPGTAFRLYGETAGTVGAIGSIQTGMAIANVADTTTTVTVELFRLDGSSMELKGTLSLPPDGQDAKFIDQIQGLESLEAPFQGIVRLTSTAPISVVGLRGRFNERKEFLVTTTPSHNEATPTSTSQMFFPQIADSGGYTTQFILFSGSPGLSTQGRIQFFDQSGQPLGILPTNPLLP